MDNSFPQPISLQIWEGKYRLQTPSHIPDDKTVQDTWDRIAEACAYAPHALNTGSKLDDLEDVDRVKNFHDFQGVLEDFNFLPAGRITAGAGSGRNVTLFNCYVMGTVPDDISGIFEMLREAALTMQQGGGIGYDFSTLRPAGSPVKGVDADASGPLTFMDVWSAMCKTIMSAGYRRGAMMATMRCDHPDIEAFVVAKHDPTRLRMFNMSVLCTDKFMTAVQEDTPWDLVHISSPAVVTDIVGQDQNGNALLVHKTISARELWNLIMKSTYDTAEPGVLFIDRINQMNNLWAQEEICATNPCGEQPLPPYGACLLGSINLSKMVTEPFSGDAFIDYARIKHVTKTAVRLLDSVIDISNFPLPQQREEALHKRRMGIGITGLADMLFMMDIIYGSDEAAETAELVMSTIAISAYEASIELAKEFGPCPALLLNKDRKELLESGFMAIMPEHIKKGIITHGLRNALLTSIAPTGTISLYAGNISSGIEPIFAAHYVRKILEDDGVTKREETVQDYAVHLLHTITVETRMPKEMMIRRLATAQTLTPADHLIMLKAVQPWVDSSISKTINCPEDISFQKFQRIYVEAYQMGLKGCTTYRPNEVTGSVLSVESDEPEEAVDGDEANPLLLTHPITEPMDRPQNLSGTTYKLKWDTKSFYVTINDYVDSEDNIIPFEIFINSSEMANLQWTVALTRMISAILRRGGQVKFIGEELKRISDPTGGFWINKKFVSSFVALLGQCILDHMDLIDDLNDKGLPQEKEPEHMFKKCPECNDYSMVVSGGCATCTNCGHSKCG